MIASSGVRALARALVWWLPPAVLLLAASAFSVAVHQERVTVHWAPATSAQTRTAVQLAHGLAYGRSIEDSGPTRIDTFILVDSADGTLSHLQRHPAVRALDIPHPSSAGTLAPRLSVERVPSYAWLIDWQPQSTVLLLAAALLLAGARAVRRSVRAAVTLAALVLVGIAALSLPVDAQLHMGDSDMYTASRERFERDFNDENVGFESHLSVRVIRWLDRRVGGDTSPAVALTLLSRAATGWFLMMLLAAAAVDRFSPQALRYLALAAAAPASVMYFGYLEVGYLSLTPAVFPLVMQGLQGRRGRLEAGALLAGLGAALHGFGLLSIIGTVAAALTARAAFWTRIGLAGRALAFASTAYLGWIFIYVVAQKLTILPSDAGEIPWRSMTETVLQQSLVNWAVLSPRGALEIAAAAWMVGVPLAIAAFAGGLRDAPWRPVLAFTIPSLVFLCGFWPIQGLAVEADLLVAAFPAVYALSWLAARSPRSTLMGVLLLAGSHVVFWRVLFSDAFVASRL